MLSKVADGREGKLELLDVASLIRVTEPTTWVFETMCSGSVELTAQVVGLIMKGESPALTPKRLNRPTFLFLKDVIRVLIIASFTIPSCLIKFAR